MLVRNYCSKGFLTVFVGLPDMKNYIYWWLKCSKSYLLLLNKCLLFDNEYSLVSVMLSWKYHSIMKKIFSLSNATHADFDKEKRKEVERERGFCINMFSSILVKHYIVDYNKMKLRKQITFLLYRAWTTGSGCLTCHPVQDRLGNGLWHLWKKS